jgi:hypothetical protein
MDISPVTEALLLYNANINQIQISTLVLTNVGLFIIWSSFPNYILSKAFCFHASPNSSPLVETSRLNDVKAMTDLQIN